MFCLCKVEQKYELSPSENQNRISSLQIEIVIFFFIALGKNLNMKPLKLLISRAPCKDSILHDSYQICIYKYKSSKKTQ